MLSGLAFGLSYTLVMVDLNTFFVHGSRSSTPSDAIVLDRLAVV